jgi:uncharacterized protein involved in type VI secretion and phage assembly
MNRETKYFGKYRGTISSNDDPCKLGRVRAIIPAVFGDKESGWALPCAFLGGEKVGFLCIPPVGAEIWVEFEAGNCDVPIWSGCFWTENNMLKAESVDIRILKTAFATITLNDTSEEKGITIETSNVKIVLDKNGIELSNKGPKIILDKNGIELSNETSKVVLDKNGIELSNKSQKIQLGSSNVSINNGALEVT